MDSRTALKPNTLLRFEGGYEYIVAGELARGGSSIVYDGFYYDNTGDRKRVRIKECYPFKCCITRNNDDSLSIKDEEQELFSETRKKIIRAYKLGNEFFSTDGLTNLTSNTYNLFAGNNTVYVVSVYAQGRELSYSRYASVKDSIPVVRTVADTIRRIHNKGYLYLDIKPSNVFTLDGTTDIVQLFDFDTLVSTSDTRGGFYDPSDTVSFSKGFASLEQQCGDHKRIGKHSDVYGIGALLFYMLFNRVPDAFDCEPDAEYDYNTSKLTGKSYRDQLTFRLTDFFHNTLANFYLDRYSNMETVVEKLSELCRLADSSVRFIRNSKVFKPDFVIGRTSESAWINSRLTSRDNCCFFIVGMGGIGKSTLIRECIRQTGSSFDTMLYLNYRESLENTICNDEFVSINAVCRDNTEDIHAYYSRKLKIMREISDGKRCLLVIDNYTGSGSHAFEKLLHLNWNIVFITRNKALSSGFERLEVGALSDRVSLVRLFEDNLGRPLAKNEIGYAEEIIEKVAGHTLVIELIAKQIGNPINCLTVEGAANLVRKEGFTNLSEGKTVHRKDNIDLYNGTVKSIISKLFDEQTLTSDKKCILKLLALFGDNGIAINKFCELSALACRDEIADLYQNGWIYVSDKIITLHPVIAEVVSDWALAGSDIKAVQVIMNHLIIRLRNEAESNNKTKQSPIALFGSRRFKSIRHKKHPCELTNEIDHSAAKNDTIDASAHDSSKAREALHRDLQSAVSLLRECKKRENLRSLEQYRILLYYTAIHLPREQEKNIRELSEEFIIVYDHTNAAMLLRVYNILLDILYEHGNIETAEKKIIEAKHAIIGNVSPYIWGWYFYLLAGYYDAALDGNYDAETQSEKQLLSGLSDSVNKAIMQMRLSCAGDSEMFLGELYRLKAVVLIRSGRGKTGEIKVLLDKIQKSITKHAPPFSLPYRDYYMTCAWYHTYYAVDHNRVKAYIEKATEITEAICYSDLDKIDELYSPAANIYLECKSYDDAVLYLLHSVHICEKHNEITAYRKKKLEMLSHLLRVYYEKSDFEMCELTISSIDSLKEAFDTSYSARLVPDHIREAVHRRLQ